MKKITQTFTLFSILFLGFASITLAAPWKSNGADIVNRHSAVDLSIVGEEGDHNGIDIVMRAGKSGVFHQWFEGESDKDGLVGKHSVWKPAKNEKCNDNAGWHLVNVGEGFDAAPYGGEDYFDDYSYYCVKTNNYNPAYYQNNYN